MQYDNEESYYLNDNNVYFGDTLFCDKISSITTSQAIDFITPTVFSQNTPITPSLGKVTLVNISGDLSIVDSSSIVQPLFPQTTKGDIIVRGTQIVQRLPVGNNNQVLTADSSEPLGVRWGNSSGGPVEEYEENIKSCCYYGTEFPNISNSTEQIISFDKVSRFSRSFILNQLTNKQIYCNIPGRYAILLNINVNVKTNTTTPKIARIRAKLNGNYIQGADAKLLVFKESTNCFIPLVLDLQKNDFLEVAIQRQNGSDTISPDPYSVTFNTLGFNNSEMAYFSSTAFMSVNTGFNRYTWNQEITQSSAFTRINSNQSIRVNQSGKYLFIYNITANKNNNNYAVLRHTTFINNNFKGQYSYILLEDSTTYDNNCSANYIYSNLNQNDIVDVYVNGINGTGINVAGFCQLIAIKLPDTTKVVQMAKYNNPIVFNSTEQYVNYDQIWDQDFDTFSLFNSNREIQLNKNGRLFALSVNTLDNLTTIDNTAITRLQYRNTLSEWRDFVNGESFEYVLRPSPNTNYNTCINFNSVEAGSGYRIRQGIRAFNNTNIETTGFACGILCFILEETTPSDKFPLYGSEYKFKQDPITIQTSTNQDNVKKTIMNVGLVETGLYVIEVKYITFSGNRRYEVTVSLNGVTNVIIDEEDNPATATDKRFFHKKELFLTRGVYFFEVNFRNTQSVTDTSRIEMRDNEMTFYRIK